MVLRYLCNRINELAINKKGEQHGNNGYGTDSPRNYSRPRCH